MLVIAACSVTLLCRFVGQLLQLLVRNNEKFGAQIQKHVKELVGHEMSPALYPILFDQIKAIVEKFFDQQGQVRLYTNPMLLLLITYCSVVRQSFKDCFT
jgi:hypothetical protein